MTHHNRWPHGLRDFRFPNAAASRERLGCTLHRTAFDGNVGEEVFLLFREESQYIGQ